MAGRLGNILGHSGNYPRVKWFWYDVGRFEGILSLENSVSRVLRIGSAQVLVNLRRYRLTGDLGQGPAGGHLHFFIDPRGANIEGTAEDARDSEYVIDLVGEVRPSGADHGGSRLQGGIRVDFRVRIGHGENYRILGHRVNHFRG